jgi:hypothetical protein
VKPPDQAAARGAPPPIPPLYQRAIGGCLRHDAQATAEVLIELILALNFEYELAAGELFSLYDRCLRGVRAGRFALVGQILHDLHAASTDSLAAS